jgi:WD40 repeat protein
VSGEALPNSLDCEQPVSAMKFGPDNRALYVGGDDGIVQAWDVDNGQAFGEPIREIGGIVSLDLTSDGKKLLVATGAGGLRVWQRPARNPVADLWQQNSDVGVLAVSPKGDRLFLASKESGRLWDLSNGQPLAKAIQHESEILCATFSPDGIYLLTGSVDETAHLWLAATGEIVGDVSSHQGSVIHVAFHPGSKLFVTATESGVAQLWETASRTARGKEINHDGKITSVDFEPSGKRFLTASIDGRINLWRSENAEATGTVLLASGEFTCARFSPSGDRIASGLSDGTFQLWSGATGQPVSEKIFLKDGVSDLAFSPDGRSLATSSRDNVSIWNADGSGREELPNQAANISAIVFSPDSKTIATASKDGIARLWDAETGRPLSEALRHPGEIRGIAFNPDGKTFFCAAGRALRVWEATTGLTSSDHATLATLAREFSSVTLRESARLQPRVMGSLHKLREFGAASTGHVALLTNWLWSTPAERTLTPFSRKKLPDEIAPVSSPNE